MKRDDSLWKGILDDLIVHFLHFFFEEADQGALSLYPQLCSF